MQQSEAQVLGILIASAQKGISSSIVKNIKDNQQSYQKTKFWGSLRTVLYIIFFDTSLEFIKNPEKISKILSFQRDFLEIFQKSIFTQQIKIIYKILQSILNKTKIQSVIYYKKIKQDQIFSQFTEIAQFVSPKLANQLNKMYILQKKKVKLVQQIKQLVKISLQFNYNVQQKQYRIIFSIENTNIKDFIPFAISIVQIQSQSNVLVSYGIPNIQKYMSYMKETGYYQDNQKQNIQEKLVRSESKLIIQQNKMMQLTIKNNYLDNLLTENNKRIKLQIDSEIMKIKQNIMQIDKQTTKTAQFTDVKKQIAQNRQQFQSILSEKQQKIAKLQQISAQMSSRLQDSFELMKSYNSNFNQKINQLNNKEQYDKLKLQISKLNKNMYEVSFYYQHYTKQLNIFQDKINQNVKRSVTNVESITKKQFQKQQNQIIQIKKRIQKANELQKLKQSSENKYKQILEEKLKQLDKRKQIKKLNVQVAQLKTKLQQSIKNTQYLKKKQKERQEQYQQLRQRLKKSAIKNAQDSLFFQEQINRINKSMALQKADFQIQQQTYFQNLDNKLDKFVIDQSNSNIKSKLDILNRVQIDKLEKKQMIETLNQQTNDFKHGVQKQVNNLKQSFNQIKRQIPKSMDIHSISITKQIQSKFKDIVKDIYNKIAYFEIKSRQFDKALAQNDLFNFKLTVQRRIDQANVELNAIKAIIQDHNIELIKIKRNQTGIVQKLSNQQQKIKKLNQKTDKMQNQIQEVDFRFKYRNDLLFRWKVYGSQKLRNLYARSMKDN